MDISDIKDIVVQMLAEGKSHKTVRSLLKNAVDVAVNQAVKEGYITMVFDSPEGSDSENILQEEGYVAEWFGIPGCRGETRVYIPKNKNIEEFKEWLKDVELIDNYSVITVK